MKEDCKFLLPVARGFVRGRDGKEHRCTHVECKLGYELGGRNFATGQYNQRGYYLYVKPVTVREHSTSFEMFVGGKWLLVESARRGGRAKEALARTMFESHARAAVEHLYDPEGIDFSALPPSPQGKLDDLA